MILTSPAIFLGQYDASGYLAKVGLKFSFAKVDDTRFGHLAKIHAAGIMQSAATVAGFADPGAAGMEAIGFGKLGLANVPFALSPNGGAAGDAAYFFKAMKAEMETFGKHGENMPFSGGAVGGSDGRPAVRGSVLFPKAARTVSVNTSISQLGAVVTGKRIYAALFVFAASGTLPTLDVVLKSAATVGFSGSTTRASFAQATGLTSEIVSAAGAITDEYWRLEATIAGTSPSFTFAGLVGIGDA